jgi:hypothetical protein
MSWLRKRKQASLDNEVALARSVSDSFNQRHPTLANEIGASAFTNVFDILEMLASRIVALEAQTHEEKK